MTIHTQKADAFGGRFKRNTLCTAVGSLGKPVKCLQNVQLHWFLRNLLAHLSGIGSTTHFSGIPDMCWSANHRCHVIKVHAKPVTVFMVWDQQTITKHNILKDEWVLRMNGAWWNWNFTHSSEGGWIGKISAPFILITHLSNTRTLIVGRPPWF